MSTSEKRAIISVYNKGYLLDFMAGLEELGWGMFATNGTRDMHRDTGGQPIGLLSDLVKRELGVVESDREVTAQQISGLMLVRRDVHLACLNLRPPRLEAVDEGSRKAISLDVGGISMIGAAGNSGALVVTRPSNYEGVLTRISSGERIEEQYYRQMQKQANLHIAEHLAAASRLT